MLTVCIRVARTARNATDILVSTHHRHSSVHGHTYTHTHTHTPRTEPLEPRAHAGTHATCTSTIGTSHAMGYTAFPPTRVVIVRVVVVDLK